MTRLVADGLKPVPVRQTITDFVERVCGENGVPVADCVAAFDNDGTLWRKTQMPGTQRLTDSRLIEAFAGRLWSR